MKTGLMLLLIALPAGAQDRPRFLTRGRIATLAAGSVFMAVDVVTTERALKIPGTYEINPLGRSEGARIGLKLAGLGAGLGISYVLYRSGHYKASRIVPAILGAPSLAAAVHNSTLRRRR